MAQPMHEMMVTVPPGVGPGQRIQVQPPYGRAPVMVTVPPGAGPGTQMRVQVAVQAPPPPAVSGPQPDWTCSQCTLNNEGAVATCAACDGPRPGAPPTPAPPDDDDEQLAWALAASREGLPAAPRLAMAEAAEAEAIRITAEEERVRMHARVEPSIARVAGDSRGTASTLVGMTPEEELELAMLKSRVAEEEPPELPRAPPAYQPNYSAAAPSFLNPSAPLGPLPSLVPLRGATRGPARGGAALAEGLLGSDHLGDAPLAPLVASLAAPHARPRPQDHPGLAPRAPPAPPAAVAAAAAYQPPVVPTMAEDDWDDVDRPLSGLFGGGGGGGGSGSGGGSGGSGGYVDSGGGSGGGYGKLD